jgi:hypothetical protein
MVTAINKGNMIGKYFEYMDISPPTDCNFLASQSQKMEDYLLSERERSDSSLSQRLIAVWFLYSRRR